MDLWTNEIIEKLARLIHTRECIAWIGSGLSRQSGYKLWADAIEEICKSCGIKFDKNQKKDPKYLLRIADNCKEINLNNYKMTLCKLFGDDKGMSRHAYSYLMKLPFKAYVTTNIDPLLKFHLEIENKNIYSYPYDVNVKYLYKNKSPGFYIHGIANRNGYPNVDNIVFCKSEFEEAYKNVVSSFITQVVPEQHIIFLGYRLSEPNTFECFERIVDFSRKHGDFIQKQRIIILCNEYFYDSEDKKKLDIDLMADQKRKMQLINTEIIRYDACDEEKHQEIENLLWNIKIKYEEIEKQNKYVINAGDDHEI